MPPILAPNGRPARHEINARGTYATPRNQGTTRLFRPRQAESLQRFSDPLDTREWSDILLYSRQLFAQLGDLGGAIAMKNTYAVGDWMPNYAGADAAWGEEAEEWLKEQFYPLADARGSAFDFSTSLFVDAIAMDVDGDALAVFTETGNHFPKVAFYSAARIGSRVADGEIHAGKFKGAKIKNGVIYGKRGAVLGYRVLADDADNDFDVSVRDCQMLFEPEWGDQYRGIPRVGRSLLDWLDTQDIDVFIRRGVKIENAIALSHYTESGQADTSQDYLTEDSNAGTGQSDIYQENIGGGEIMYFKAGSDERIEFNTGQRPHPNTEAFLQRLTTRALYAVSWPYQLIDPSKIGGASVRSIQDQARTGIRKRQKTVRKRALRCCQYAVAKAMKHGRLSRSDDWWKWTFQEPPQLTVDQGHDHKSDIEDLRAGNMTETAYCAKRGTARDKVRAKRYEEISMIVDQAKQLAGAHGIGLNTALDLLYQRSPNPMPIQSDNENSEE